MQSSSSPGNSPDLVAASAIRRLRTLAGRTLRRIRRESPTVSIIMPVFNSSAYLEEALDSVTTQSFRDWELIVVDDGSTDGSFDTARARAQRDSRIVVLRQPHLGPGAARNRGVLRAHGRWLTFLDSDDVLLSHALRVLVRDAEQSDADIVAGTPVRFTNKRRWTAPWVGEMQAVTRPTTTAAADPAIIRNFYPWGKLFSRDFWTRQRLEFGPELRYEDQPLITQLYVRAGSVRMLADAVYGYRRRLDSASSQNQKLDDLRDRVAAWQRSIRELTPEAPSAVLTEWLRTVYATHAHWYLDNDSIADPQYWSTLRNAVLELDATAPYDLTEQVRVDRRVAIRLLRADLHDELLAFRAAGGYRPQDFAVEERDGRLWHHLPLSSCSLDRIGARSVSSLASDLAAEAHLTGGGWGTSSVLDVEINTGFDFGIKAERVTIVARSEHGAEVSAVASENGERSYAARLDVRDLDPDVPWQLFASLERAGVARTVPVIRSRVAVLDGHSGYLEDGGLQRVIVFPENRKSPVRVETRRRAAWISATRVLDHTLELRIDTVPGGPRALAVLVDDDEFVVTDSVARVPLDRHHSGSSDEDTHRSRLRARLADGRAVPLARITLDREAQEGFPRVATWRRGEAVLEWGC